MVNVFYDENDNVNLIYYIDLPEELISLPHFSLEVLPEPEIIEGKESILKCDGEKVWYDYVDKVLSPEEILETRLKASTDRQDFLEELIAEMAMMLYV